MTLFLASTYHQSSSHFLTLPHRIFCSCSLIVSVMPLPWFLVCSRRLKRIFSWKPDHHHHHGSPSSLIGHPPSTTSVFHLSSSPFVYRLSSQPHPFSIIMGLQNHQPHPIYVSSLRSHLHRVFISPTQLHHKVYSVLTVGGRWPWWAARQICHWTRPLGQLL